MPVVFEIKEGNESLSSHSGLALIGALLRRTQLRELLDEVHLTGCREPKISHSDIVFSMTGLLCLGKPDFDAIEPFRGNPFFVQSLGIETSPSSPTLRQRMNVIGNALDEIVKGESAELIRKTAPAITPISTGIGEFVPLDIDVSPFDNSKTKKEGVSRTYKGFDGYAPIFAYVGQEGYIANVELREGSQHCQKGTPEFLKASIKYAKRITNQRLLVRLDSGNDSTDNIGICLDEGVDWIIKRNLRKEDPQQWLQLAKETGRKYIAREGKTVWQGTTYRNVESLGKPLRIVFEVTERTTKKGQILMFPEIEVDTYWSSLELNPSETIALYHDHGSSEQFHSELKTDMDLERLPSEYFKTNAVVLLFGMLAYNMLRLCGQESLREDNGNLEKVAGHRRKALRRRVRTVMLDLIYMACRITYGARRWFLSFGRHNAWASLWKSIYLRFVSGVT